MVLCLDCVSVLIAGGMFLMCYMKKKIGNEALSARKTIAELWDGRLRGGHWSGLRRRRKDGLILEGWPFILYQDKGVTRKLLAIFAFSF